MPTILSDIELRVLGSLIEKQVTTPEYYPLTLNALTLACNQKNKRHPVFDEPAVAQALETLREKNLTYVFLRQQQLRESASTSGSLEQMRRYVLNTEEVMVESTQSFASREQCISRFRINPETVSSIPFKTGRAVLSSLLLSANCQLPYASRFYADPYKTGLRRSECIRRTPDAFAATVQRREYRSLLSPLLCDTPRGRQSGGWFHCLQSKASKTELVLSASPLLPIVTFGKRMLPFSLCGQFFEISRRALFAVLAAIVCFRSRHTDG